MATPPDPASSALAGGGDNNNQNASQDLISTGLGTSSNVTPVQPVAQPAGPRFKFKYPQADPLPEGEEFRSVTNEDWNRTFTAADSRLYNKRGKNANESAKARASGETRILAIQMQREKMEKAKLEQSRKENSPNDGTGNVPVIKKAKATTSKKENTTPVMMESSPSSRDGTPGGEKLNIGMATMGIAEKIKSEGRGRKASIAASSDRGTPAPTPSLHETPLIPGQKAGTPTPAKKTTTSGPPAPPKLNRPPKKKGTATRVQKSGQKGKGKEAQGSTRKSQTPGPGNKKTTSADESGSDDGGEYCICRGPDDHRKMVGCEGGCEEWYHCTCIKMDERDCDDLLIVYICPKCKTDKKQTMWKPICRYANVGKYTGEETCRKAAAFDADPPSKYCSKEHAQAFFAFVKTLARKDDEPSKGGALNIGELNAILHHAKTYEDFQALGQKPRLPKKEGADPARPAGLDYLTEDEKKQIEEIKKKKVAAEKQISGYKGQLKLLHMINERAKIAATQPGLDVKDICGYDNRLAFNDTEFTMWANTKEGKKALETGVLGPRSAESKLIRSVHPFPGQTVAPDPILPEALENICVKGRKKCRHLGWREIHNQDFQYFLNLYKEELVTLNKSEAEIIDDAETREATKDYHAGNWTEQLF